MTGQDAVNVAESFLEEVEITGVILTKLDGDARGGAALSMAYVTGRPIKFAGVGEKLSDLEAFHPDRMASRILGMGDVLTLIEKAESAFDEAEAKEMEEKLRKAEFTFEDFLSQMQAIKKMGPMSQVLGMMPGMSKLPVADDQIDNQMPRIEAIIRSMTTAGTQQPAGSQREPAEAHSRGLWKLDPRGQQARQTVRPGAQDDEGDVRRGKGQGEDEASEGHEPAPRHGALSHRISLVSFEVAVNPFPARL